MLKNNPILKIANKSPYPMPAYAHPGDSGMDVRANISEPITLRPLERYLFPTGLSIEIPEGYEIQVRPRSGLAIKRGITVLNSPGTVDANYRGECKVILINLSNEDQVIEPGERIAQFVVAEVTQAEIERIDEVSINTERGGTGFGDSGKF